jgi:hypothetical protein
MRLRGETHKFLASTEPFLTVEFVRKFLLLFWLHTVPETMSGLYAGALYLFSDRRGNEELKGLVRQQLPAGEETLKLTSK